MSLSALRRKVPLAFSACFHAQQCAEKYMKALLVAKGVGFPRTHDLLLIAQLCAEADILIGLAPERLHALSDYAVRARYPGDEPIVEEAKDAVLIAKSVRRFARRWLGVST